MLAPQPCEIQPCKAIARFEYHTDIDSELQIDPGDEINVLSNGDNEWWYGRGRHGVGWFPRNFVEVITGTSGYSEHPSVNIPKALQKYVVNKG